MVKYPTKHPRSRSSSKDKYQGKDKSNRKSSQSMEKLVDHDKDKSKKKRHHKTTQNEEGNASIATNITEAADVAEANVVIEQTAFSEAK